MGIEGYVQNVRAPAWQSAQLVAVVRLSIAAHEAREDIVTYTQCRDDIAGGLTKMLWSASQLDEQSDFEELLEAIQVLRPKWSAGTTVIAWRYMRRQAWSDARRVLDNDDPQAKRSGLHAALMAVCLFGLEDPLWHSYARAAAERPRRLAIGCWNVR
jgi:Bacterial type III secretion protein (HrpB1_HrpK)